MDDVKLAEEDFKQTSDAVPLRCEFSTTTRLPITNILTTSTQIRSPPMIPMTR